MIDPDGLQMMPEEDQTLFAEAILGKDAEEFFATDIGRYLSGCAAKDEEDALAELADADPHEWKTIASLQAKVWRARSFKGWLAELVQRGRQAMSVLDSRHTDD